MEILRWALSLFIVVCVFLSFRFVIYFLMKRALKRWSRLQKDERLVRQEDVDLQIFSKKKTVQGYVVDKGYISQGRLILTNRRFFVVTHRGIVVEIDREKKGEVKALGPGRLLIKGLSSELLEVRVEVAIENERIWEQEIAPLSGG